MNHSRVVSSPEIPIFASHSPEKSNKLEGYGLATNVKLLLKLIQENNEASWREHDDRRKPQRMAGMITILDDVRTRIQKSQSMIGKRSMAELRRCNTDLLPNHVLSRRKIQNPVTEEQDRMRREVAARKSLEAMCSSLGKEKEIMAAELAKKVRELNESEELIGDLKAQNETLLGKVKVCAAEHKCGGRAEVRGNAALMERNSVMSQQILKSLDAYRSREEKERSEEVMKELGAELAQGVRRMQGIRQRLDGEKREAAEMEEEISKLVKMVEGFQVRISKAENGKF